MDISGTLAPNSEQLDAIELVGHPRTFVIESVSKGNAEQPVNVHLVDFPRPWRPGKSMRRVLAACWGTDASQWAGRSVRLYCDEKVRFGSEVVGGTRIAALSHIDARKSVPLLVSRGKSAMFTVEPLSNTPQAPAKPAQNSTTEPTAEQVAASTDVQALRAWWQSSGPQRRTQIEARVHELTAAPEPADTLPVEDEPTWDTDA